MNKLMLYMFPIGVVVGGAFLPLAVLLYWVANNLWTLGQQYVVYQQIDREERGQEEQAVDGHPAGPRPAPGQKPRPAGAGRARRQTTDGTPAHGKTPGAKPVTAAEPPPAGEAHRTGGGGSVGRSGTANANGSSERGREERRRERRTNGARARRSRRPPARPGRKRR